MTASNDGRLPVGTGGTSPGSVPSPASARGRHLVRHDFLAFGGARCHVLAVTDDEDEVSMAVAEVYAFEARLSRFSPKSELSLFNASAGRRVAISPLLEALLRLALEAYGQSDGLVNVAVLPTLVASGYDATIEAVRRRFGPTCRSQGDDDEGPTGRGTDPVPSGGGTGAATCPSTAVRALPVVSEAGRFSGSVSGGSVSRGSASGGSASGGSASGGSASGPPSPVVPALPAVLEVGRGWARLARGCAVDLGGIGKGWLADQLAERLGDALVDLGGDLRAVGGDESGRPWCVGLPDGRCLLVRDGGVATSGTTSRCWPGGHHIVDPRTGRPAASDLAVATVVAATASRAEILAKGCVLLGTRGASRWAAERGAWLVPLRTSREVTDVAEASDAQRRCPDA